MTKSPWIVLIFGAPIVLGGFIANHHYKVFTADELSALFTGLGFVGLVAAFRHEREKAEGADAQHRQVLEAMKDQAEAAARLARVQANACMVEMHTRDMARYEHMTEGYMSALRARTLWALRLDKESKQTD